MLEALEARGVRHRMMIVGEGPGESYLRDRLPRAIFTGFLSGDALRRAYAGLANATWHLLATTPFTVLMIVTIHKGWPCCLTRHAHAGRGLLGLMKTWWGLGVGRATLFLREDRYLIGYLVITVKRAIFCVGMDMLSL